MCSVAVIYQACLRGSDIAAGRYGDARGGGKTLQRAQTLFDNGLLGPTRICPIPCPYLRQSLLTHSGGGFRALGRDARRLIVFAFHGHGPEAPRHLIGQRMRHDQARFLGEHTCEP